MLIFNDKQQGLCLRVTLKIYLKLISFTDNF
jgi:hypothetical protein